MIQLDWAHYTLPKRSAARNNSIITVLVQCAKKYFLLPRLNTTEPKRAKKQKSRTQSVKQYFLRASKDSRRPKKYGEERKSLAAAREKNKVKKKSVAR